MKEDMDICIVLKELNHFITSIRTSYNLSREFEDAHCRLRCENSTRWGSQYLCLEVILKVRLKI